MSMIVYGCVWMRTDVHPGVLLRLQPVDAILGQHRRPRWGPSAQSLLAAQLLSLPSRV